MMTHTTLAQLRSLKLDGFAAALEEQLAQPTAGALAFEERLALLIDRELLWRNNRKLARLLQRARLKYPLVLLCHKFSLTSQQHGQRGSLLMIARAMSNRNVEIESGTCRWTRWAAAREVTFG